MSTALAEAESKAERRPLLVYVRAAWSTACLEIERSVFVRSTFRRATRSFVPLWIDATDEETLAELKARFGVQAVPALALLDPVSGRRVVLSSRAEIERAEEALLAFVE